MTQLPNTFFSASASDETARCLSMLYKKKAIRSINHIIKCFHEVTLKDFNDLFLKIKNISEDSSNATSEFYYLNYKLISAIKEKKNMKLAEQTLEDFLLAPNEILIKEKIVIENISHYRWAMEFMNYTEKDANKINGKKFSKIIQVNDKELSWHIHTVNKCLENLKEQLSTKAFFQEINHYVSHIILYDGLGITGASSSRTMGTIYIRIPKQRDQETSKKSSPISLSCLPPSVYYLEQLIHETAHLHLDQLMIFDQLILNPDNEKYISPIRIDPRPMRGILHATYVLARLYLFYNLYDFKSDWLAEAKEKRKKAILTAYKRGLCVLNKSAILTDKGKKLIFEIEKLFENGG